MKTREKEVVVLFPKFYTYLEDSWEISPENIMKMPPHKYALNWYVRLKSAESTFSLDVCLLCRNQSQLKSKGIKVSRVSQTTVMKCGKWTLVMVVSSGYRTGAAEHLHDDSKTDVQVLDFQRDLNAGALLLHRAWMCKEEVWRSPPHGNHEHIQKVFGTWQSLYIQFTFKKSLLQNVALILLFYLFSLYFL